MLTNETSQRLDEFLAAEYPKLRCFVGAVAFARMVEAHARRFPPQPLRWLAAQFPQGIERPELAELAAFELALNEAQHAPDESSLGFADLIEASPALHRLNPVIHPSARCIAVRTNIASVWSSLNCSEPPPRLYNLQEPQSILVWRQKAKPRFRMLGPEEKTALDAAKAGWSCAAIAQKLALSDETGDAEARLLRYLRGWIEAEIICCFRDAASGGEK